MSLCAGVAVSEDFVSVVIADADMLSSPLAQVCVPPVLVITPQGVAVGAHAERLAASGTGAVFHEFTNRVGDPVPIVGSDGTPRLGADLVAMTIGSIIRGRARRSDLGHLTIAHPSGWGPYEVSVLLSALSCTEAGGIPTSLVNSPNSAVTAAIAAGAIRPFETVIVLDVGSHGTEAALVTSANNHPGRLEATSRTDGLGSAGLDRTLARHVLEQVRGHLPVADLSNPANRAIVEDVITACRRAREDLIRHPSTIVSVHLPAERVPVRIVRAEFETLAYEPIRAGLRAIANLIDHACKNNITADAILLTGEIARTPLLTELISAQWPIRVVTPPNPKWAVTSGAAHLAARYSQYSLTTPHKPTHQLRFPSVTPSR
jgi:Hsp70 protein